MRPKKCRGILNGLALVVMGLVFLSYIPTFGSIRKEMVSIAALLIIGDLIFGFIFLRCPNCKKLLNIRWSSQGVCHNCGARLDD